MKIYKNKFKDMLIFKSKKFKDKRGYFRELSLEKYIKKKLIFTVVSKSKKNVLRGMHMQKKKMQGKYISVIKGKILDVVIDCRKKSKTFGKHFKIILSDKNATSLYIPPGFAHGFLSMEKDNIVVYSCTNYRDANSEISISWNDKNLDIKWPVKDPLVSKKDSMSSPFNSFFI
jgi:dTDP-4-dehydrorhamnose 3,5-epimerase